MFPPFFPADHRVGPNPHLQDIPPPRRGAPARLRIGGDIHAVPYLPAAPPDVAAPPVAQAPAQLFELAAHPRFQPRPAPRGWRIWIARALVALSQRLAQPRRA